MLGLIRPCRARKQSLTLVVWALPPPFQRRRENDLPPLQAQEELLRGARVLVNTAFGLDYPRALPPLLQMTGPLMPSGLEDGRAPPLPQIISNWLQVRVVPSEQPPVCLA